MRFYTLISLLCIHAGTGLGQDNQVPPFKDQGIWNEFHQNHVGKLVFSSEKIIHNAPDPNLVKDTFDLTQPIKTRLYLSKSLANTCAEMEESGLYEKDAFNYTLFKQIDLVAEIKIDGFSPIKFTMPVIESYTQKQEWTTWWYSLIPDESSDWKRYPEQALEYNFGKALSTLSAGIYNVHISFSMRALNPKLETIIPLAGGSFVLAFSESDKKVWLNDIQPTGTDSGEEPMDSDVETPSEYVVFKNNCSEKIDIEYDSNGSTYSNTFIVSGGQIEFKMRTGDQLRSKDGAILYTHTYGSTTTIYLCK